MHDKKYSSFSQTAGVHISDNDRCGKNKISLSQRAFIIHNNRSPCPKDSYIQNKWLLTKGILLRSVYGAKSPYFGY